jgi:hypothetical protein
MFRKHHKRWAWVWVVALLCFAQISQAQVYTWTDENGKRHFGDEVSTPENRRESPVKVPPPNIAERFTPTLKSDSASQTSGEVGSNAPPAIPAQGQRSQSGAGAKQSQNMCEAQKQAYASSAACFAACGRTICTRGQGCRRNNSECGHCQAMSPPNC